MLLPLQHLHCDHSWTRFHDAAAALHVCTRVNRPSACEAATCAPTVREGGKIGRDEHPLDCSAEKHCGYLPPTRQPPSAPAKHNQRRIIPIRMTTYFFRATLRNNPWKMIKTAQLVRTHLPLSNGHALSGPAARCLASSHGRLRRTTFFCVLRRGLPWLWHQVSVGHPQTPHPLDKARKVLLTVHTTAAAHNSGPDGGCFSLKVCAFFCSGPCPFFWFFGTILCADAPEHLAEDDVWDICC